MTALLLLLIILGPDSLRLLAADRQVGPSCSAVQIHRPPISIEVRCDAHEIWQLRVAGAGTYSFAPAVLPLASGPVSVSFGQEALTVDAVGGVFAVSGRLQELPDLTLRILFQVTPASPIVRFRYELQTSNVRAHYRFGEGPLDYFSIAADRFTHAREVELADFQGLTHSYNLNEIELSTADFAARSKLLGPILAFTDDQHGPDRFRDGQWQP